MRGPTLSRAASCSGRLDRIGRGRGHVARPAEHVDQQPQVWEDRLADQEGFLVGLAAVSGDAVADELEGIRDRRFDLVVQLLGPADLLDPLIRRGEEELPSQLLDRAAAERLGDASAHGLRLPRWSRSYEREKNLTIEHAENTKEDMMETIQFS